MTPGVGSLLFGALVKNKEPPAVFGNTVTINLKSKVCKGDKHEGRGEELHYECLCYYQGVLANAAPSQLTPGQINKALYGSHEILHFPDGR